jgi:CRP-like cAMP-binding protein
MPSLSLFDNDSSAMLFPAEHRFFDAGDDGDFMYVVLDGVVDLELRGVTLETVRAGGFFGEMALIDKRERSASAVAKSECKVARVDQRRFLYLVQNTPFFALEIMTTMSDRLRRVDATINSSGQLSSHSG